MFDFFDVPDDLDEFNAFALIERWSDGLPLVPPTSERVERMLGYWDRPTGSLGLVPPRWAEADPWRVAANAVMAGCLPEYFPVVATAVAAACDPSLNLHGALATTHPNGIMVMLNGPIGREIGVNSGSGAFGAGSRANATIGRAVRLVCQNIGGSYFGDTDRSTLGSPVKYSFCFAENEDASPWPPYHVHQGFLPNESTVTVCPTEPPHNISDHISTDPKGLLGVFAQVIADLGGNNPYMRDAELFVGICPEHMQILDRKGWTRADVQTFLFVAAGVPHEVWRDRGEHGVHPIAKFKEGLSDGMLVPMVDCPSDFRVICVGGAGLHSCWIPTFAVGRSVTRRIDIADGTAATTVNDFKVTRLSQRKGG